MSPEFLVPFIEHQFSVNPPLKAAIGLIDIARIQ